jgi:hypothetical protein
LRNSLCLLPLVEAVLSFRASVFFDVDDSYPHSFSFEKLAGLVKSLPYGAPAEKLSFSSFLFMEVFSNGLSDWILLIFQFMGNLILSNVLSWLG